MRLYIYCEGQTEERFIKNVLAPYLSEIAIYALPIICTTSRTQTKKYKGGVSNYLKIRRELLGLCKEHKNEKITTMFDYYGMPSDTPGVENASGTLYERVSQIEKAVEADINMPNLFFSLIVHEFEGLLFADTSVFQAITSNEVVKQLEDIRDEFVSPEHINNSTETAPSKRILTLIPDYSKVLDGTSLSKQIGINAMLAECEHFNKWVQKIRAIRSK